MSSAGYTLAVVDADLYETARAAIGQQYGLTPAQSKRLKGTTAADLHDDAKAMRSELGLGPVRERERDEQGRFIAGENGADMNALIRQRAGRL